MNKSHVVIALIFVFMTVSAASAQRLKRTDGPDSGYGNAGSADYQSPAASAEPAAGLPLRGIGTASDRYNATAPDQNTIPVDSQGAQSFNQMPGRGTQSEPYLQLPHGDSHQSRSYSQPLPDNQSLEQNGQRSDPVMYVHASSNPTPESARQRTMVRIPATPVLSVTQNDLQLLARHDIVLMIDKSSSMKERDCPGGMSRWEWCQQQLMNLSRATSSLLPEGLSVVLFSTSSHVFTRVSVNDIPRIFTSYSPGGFTNEAGAVDRVFTDYFHRREGAHGKIKPLLIAVITDGLPTDPQGLRDVIIDATRNVKAGEMKMTFLQVGSDPKGIHFVREMDQQLVGEGAAFDMVSSKTFPELLGSGGLTKALVDCISEHGSR